jgi:hypothetical protein
MTFFTRQPFSVLDSRDGTPYLKRISSIIRGEQMANYLGAKLNSPEAGLSIHIKPLKFNNVKNGDYVDVLDDVTSHVRLGSLIGRLKKLPEVNVIAMTTAHQEWLAKQLPNKIVHIPHYHVNFEKHRRTRKEVTTCGYIGMYVGQHEDTCKMLKQRLAKEGIDFIYTFSYPTRQDVINFYQKIDVQIIPFFNYLTQTPYYHEKKILDAMSFGIPTISEERLGYRDVADFYLQVRNTEEIVAEVKKLQQGWDAERLINKAEEYHISNIALKYKQL